jgi:hypothetical protein
MWAEDRLHLTAAGHERVAEAVWQTLGLPPRGDWTLPLPPEVRAGWATRRVSDLRFTRAHLLPWIGRRLTGRSSGDGREPKRAELLPYAPPTAGAAHSAPLPSAHAGRAVPDPATVPGPAAVPDPDGRP